ncbi:MAG TPA: hypothetical protein DCY88_32000 [Cyanobacteria bacterium UBA11372]|nr:hypothetical protein [Cyanobacteria bacterium UBA11372]
MFDPRVQQLSEIYAQLFETVVEQSRLLAPIIIDRANGIATALGKSIQQQETQKIAQAALGLIDAYGEMDGNDTKIYKSDAFVIRQQGQLIGIHHRPDELTDFVNPLMEFTIGKNDHFAIKTPPKAMLPSEKEEFLMVSDRLESGLPNAKTDLRDLAAALGSLAPAGTLSTLESFRQTEALGLLNQILEKAKTDEIQVGDYLISRRRNLEDGKGQLCLKKGDLDLVKYTVQKTPQGLIKQLDKLNLTQWDWQQIQFIARNTKSLNGLDGSLVSSVGNKDSLPFVSQIKVPLHPALKKAWDYLNQHGWSVNTQAGNDRIKATLEQSKGRLSVAEQRELYYKCLLHHQELMSAPNPIHLPSIKDVMKDLERWRKQAISAHYTPIQHLAINQEKAADTQAEIAL